MISQQSTYTELFRQKLNDFYGKGYRRNFITLTEGSPCFPDITYEEDEEEKRAINFCSNNYLGMSRHPEVVQAMIKVLLRLGAGSCGTRNLSGNTYYHKELEKRLAKWHGKENALLFSGAYLANVTALQTLGKALPELVFLSDEYNHASMIEGIRNSGNRKIIFRHNNLSDLKQKLQLLGEDTPKMIVFESVYSISGTVSPVRDIVQLAREYNAMTYVDEVHAVGLYGSNGAGITEQEECAKDIDIINGTLSKAIGVFGGYIAASSDIIELIRSFGKGFIFTTSLPPAVCAGALQSIDIIQKDHTNRKRLFDNVVYLRKLLRRAHIDYRENKSQITQVLIPDINKLKETARQLLQKGYYVQPVFYPTVPEGESCLRIVVTAAHQQNQIEGFVNALATLYHE
ncbi:MAG: 5-aminolevulinate synthase [Chitinophagaceae bacterium]|nr:5-aminolevulinate synthase [Chitinophagaceae bacterium]